MFQKFRTNLKLTLGRKIIIIFFFLLAYFSILFRFYLDVCGVPYKEDFNENYSYSDILLSFSFYSMLYVFFYKILEFNKLYFLSSLKYGLICLILYQYIHLLEYVIDTNGRITPLPPKNHFWKNYLTFFIQTKDAGFWQILRIFLVGAYVLIILNVSKSFFPRKVFFFLYYCIYTSTNLCASRIMVFLPESIIPCVR